jgi:uncharacterized protein (TIGR00369 family)
MAKLDPSASPNPIASDLQAAQKLADSIPHGHELGIEVEAIAPGRAQFILPFHPRLIGNPDSGTLHGGVITTLIDTASGCAVFSALPNLIPIATLDLRIDYLKPATPQKPLRADARCYKLTRYVGFTRAFAYHDDPQDPIANSVGTFMVGSSNAVFGVDDLTVERSS